MALDNLSKICKSEKNIFPACIECALSRCTEEEMFRVFLKSFKGWTK
jgi:hypothetical protein